MAIPAQRRVARTKALIQLEELVLAALADMKAVNIRVMDVRGLTDVADTMIIASGTSDRHVRSIADLVIERAKQAGRRPMGTEGKDDAEWVLVDLQDVLVHLMLPRVREFYALEELWEAPVVARAQKVPAKSKRAAAKPEASRSARAESAASRPAKVTSRARSKVAGRSRTAPGGSRSVTLPRSKRPARPRPSRPRG